MASEPDRSGLAPWMLIVPAAWAGTFIVADALLTHVSPTTTTLLRFGIGAPLMLVVLYRPMLAVLRARPDARTWILIVLLGALGVPGYHWIFHEGLRHTPPSVSAVLIATNPMWTAIGAYVVARDRPLSRWIFFSVAMAGVGSVLLVSDKSGQAVATVSDFFKWGRGETLTLIAAFAWSAYTLMLGRMDPKLPTGGVTMLIFGAGTLMLALICAFTGSWTELGRLGGLDWGHALYLGVISTFIGYTLFNASVGRAGPASAGLLVYLVPVFTILLAMVFDDAFAPSVKTPLGLSLVVLGLAMHRGPAALRNAFR